MNIDQSIEYHQKKIDELLLRKASTGIIRDSLTSFLLMIGFEYIGHDTFVKKYPNNYSCEIILNETISDAYSSLVLRRDGYFAAPAAWPTLDEVKDLVEKIEKIDFENPYKISVTFELSGISPQDIYRNLEMTLEEMTQEEIHEKFGPQH